MSDKYFNIFISCLYFSVDFLIFINYRLGMDKKEATDKKIEAMNMYDKLNFENQNTVFMVLKGMLISQENTKKICDVNPKENV